MSTRLPQIENEVIVGGPDDFLAVRRLVLRGSQVDIGRQLAAEAVRRGWRPDPIDPVVNRARANWFARNWPEHRERMTGIAEALGLDSLPEDRAIDALDLTPGRPYACSTVWCPPESTVDGHGRLARNYDFFTLSAGKLMAMYAPEGADLPPDSGEAMASQPYVVTTIPDEGYASTWITMSELDGCMDGINEKGLAVVLLIADIENTEAQPGLGKQVGLGSAQLPRFLLDTCATVEEAQQALLEAKQYDQGTPLHYLIADASGRAFGWENGAYGTEHIIERDSGPLCVTNHLLHKNPDINNLPPDTPESVLTYQRARTLAKSTEGVTLSEQDLRNAIDEVEVAADPHEPWRTIWRTVFDTSDRTMTACFYLGDNADGTSRRSEEITFTPGRIS